MSKDIEKGGIEKGETEKENKGMSQSMKEDCQVYVTVLLFILFGTLLVMIKIALIDMNPEGKYSSIFGSDQPNMTISQVFTTTTSPTTTYYNNSL